jgi:dihydroorotase
MIYEIAKRAVELKIIGFKVYPYGVTTESKYGVKNYDKIDLCLQAIAAVNASVGKRFERPFIVQIHGEHPDFNVHFMDKEWNFLAIFSQKVIKFPDVKFSLEHISDHRSIELIKRLPDNAVGGIAIHHCIIWGNNIVYALDDQGHPHPALQPHNFCMPIAKRLEDMKAIVQAACSGSHKFSFQNDTAIHAKGRKETSCGCAGIYHGKFSLQLAAGLFDQMGKLDNLEIFTSINASRFYELPFNEGEITLVEEEETIPNEYSIPGTSDTVVPFMAGQKVKWQVRVPEPKPAAKAPSPPSIF